MIILNNEYLWESFAKSGRIDDYLKYKENENDYEAELNNADYNQGFSNSRADSGRE